MAASAPSAGAHAAGDRKMNTMVFVMPSATRHSVLRFRDTRPDQGRRSAARVRRGGRKPEGPRDARSMRSRYHEGAEDDVVVDDRGIDDPLADRRRDLQVEDEERDRKLKKAATAYRHRAGFRTPRRDHGRDGIGRVVQPVHEVEGEREDHQEYQRARGSAPPSSSPDAVLHVARSPRARCLRPGSPRPGSSGRSRPRAARRSPSS